jgi:uncharacterized protein YutE (UPF0331/DUF86 family)
MLNGVISGKLANLDVILAELETTKPLTTEALQASWQLRKAIERNIQLAVEIVLDICHRLIALEGRAPTPTSRGAVEAVAQIGVLSSAEPYKQMVGMRNILVHRYEFVDPEKLKAIVNEHLGDFQQFKEEVLLYARNQTSAD